MTETLFNLLVTIFIFYVLRYIKIQQLKYLIIAAILLTVSIYVRPISLYLPFVTTLSLLILTVKNKIKYKKLAIHIAIFLLIPLSFTSLWQLRNMTVAGQNFLLYQIIISTFIKEQQY